MRRTRHSLRAAALLAAGLGSAPGLACTVTAAAVPFGVYDTTNQAPDDGAGSISVSCHPSEKGPTIALSAGSSGTFSSRRMTAGPGNLNYNLYTSASRTIVWGNGSGGSATVTLSTSSVGGGQRVFSGAIYGRIPARQNVPSGTYSDLIMVTVTF